MDCVGANTTFQLSYAGGCVWLSTTRICVGTVVNDPQLSYSGGSWTVTLQAIGGTGSPLTLVSGPFNCLGRNVFQGVAQPGALCAGTLIQAVLSWA